MCSVLSRNILNVGRFFYKSSHAYTCKVLEFSRIIPINSYSSDKKIKNDFSEENENEERDNLPGGIKTEYELFRDENAPIIFDVDEEKKRLNLEKFNAMQNVHDPYEGLNMKRGVDGVFDIEDLVEMLKKDRAQNIFVAKVPKEWSYVNYIVFATGKSVKHIRALATFIRKAYKLKKNENDVIPKIEGANSKDWVALDLGNIALHIFTKPCRDLYDLETLWGIGSEYDRKSHKIESEHEFESRYMKFLEGLEPADEEELDSDSKISNASKS